MTAIIGKAAGIPENPDVTVTFDTDNLRHSGQRLNLSTLTSNTYNSPQLLSNILNLIILCSLGIYQASNKDVAIYLHYIMERQFVCACYKTATTSCVLFKSPSLKYQVVLME